MSINKTTIKELQGMQQELSKSLDVVSSMQAAQDEIREVYEDKGEKAQESMDEKYPWLQDFLDLDLSELQTQIEMASGLDLEG